PLRPRLVARSVPDPAPTWRYARNGATARVRAPAVLAEREGPSAQPLGALVSIDLRPSLRGFVRGSQRRRHRTERAGSRPASRRTYTRREWAMQRSRRGGRCRCGDETWPADNPLGLALRHGPGRR